MDYSIWINNEEIPVSEAVYRVYWKGARKERYFLESDMHNHVFSYDALDTEDRNGGELFVCDSDMPVEEQVIGEMETNRLHEAVESLSADEAYMIERLYFDNVSMRSFSQESGIPLSTLHYKHQRVLRKLKKHLDGRWEGFLQKAGMV